MKIYKRLELTPDTIRQWEYDSQFDMVSNTASTLPALTVAINPGDRAVKMCDDGNVLFDDLYAGKWRNTGKKYEFYLPGRAEYTGKIIRGPW